MAAQNTDDPNTYDQNYDTQYDDTYDQPVEDAAYTDEDHATDGDWSDDGDVTDEDGETFEQPAKKKKSKFTTIIIVAVAIIGVLGFLLLKGGKAPPQQATTPPVTAGTDANGQQPQPTENPLVSLKNGTEESAPVAPPVDTSAQPAAQGLMDNPTLVDQTSALTTEPAPAPASAPAPTTAPPVSTMTTLEPEPTPPQAPPETPPVEVAPVAATPQPAPQPQGLADAITPDVKPVSDFPTVDSIKKNDTAPTPVAAPVAIPDPAETAPQTLEQVNTAPTAPQQTQKGEDSEAFKALEAKITALEKNLAEKDAALQEQQNKPSISPEEVDSLKAKIADLESRLASKNTEVSSHEYDAPRESVRTNPVKKQPTVKPSVSKKVASGWVLKSARPGYAILGDKGTGDSKAVALGQTVPGLGKITTISETPTGWVVQGTQGKVSE